MGTSSSYKGPIGTNPLLPPWADDIFPEGEVFIGENSDLPGVGSDSNNESNSSEEDSNPSENSSPHIDEQQNNSEGAEQNRNNRSPNTLQPDLSWAGPKRVMGRIASNYDSSKGSSIYLAGLGRSFVRASGGSRTAASASRAGRRTTARLGNFLSTGIRDGFRTTVEDLGLGDLVGKDVNSVLEAFVELLSPEADLGDDIAARTALFDTLEDLFDQYDLEEKGFEGLDSLNEAALGETLQLYITNYINERILQVLANCIERKTKTETEANQLMHDIQEFVKELVKLDFSNRDLLTVDWRGLQGRQLVEGLYEDAYKLIGDE